MAINRTGVEVLQAWFKSVPGDKSLRCIVGREGARRVAYIPSNKLFVWLVTSEYAWKADCSTITTNFIDPLRIELDMSTEDGTKHITVYHSNSYKK